jgi:hypothetical protein
MTLSYVNYFAEHSSHLAELQHAHDLKVASKSEQIEELRKQLFESESLLSMAGEDATVKQNEAHTLTSMLEKSKMTAKEEEEKRVKAVGLLKTVRQKLVKTERERDELNRDLLAARTELDKGINERAALQNAMGAVKSDAIAQIAEAKVSWHKEMANQKTEMEKATSSALERMKLDLSATNVRAYSQMMPINTNLDFCPRMLLLWN